MKVLRVGAIAVAVLVAALAGSVMLGGANAGVPATYYACADTETSVLRRVDPEGRCAEGEERLVWSDGQPTPEPAAKQRSCSISFQGDLFEKNIADYSGFDAALLESSGCAPGWSGMTRVEITATITYERNSADSFAWIEPQIDFGGISLSTTKNCSGPEWGCIPAPGRLSDGAAGAQLSKRYGDCKSGRENPCTVKVAFSATEFLESGQPLYAWINIARIVTPESGYQSWDRSQDGSRVVVTGEIVLTEAR